MVAPVSSERAVEAPPAPWTPPPPTPWGRGLEPRTTPPAGENGRRAATTPLASRSEAPADLPERPPVRLSRAAPSFTLRPPAATAMIQMSLAPAVVVLLAIVAGLALYLLAVRTG